VTDGAVQSEGAVRLRRPLISRKISPALFTVILVAFALPFGTVSCEGPPVKFTGYELATWHVQQTSPPATTDDGKSLPAEIEHKGSIDALLMLGGAVVGLALGLVGRRGAGFAVAVGLFGSAALWSNVFQMFGPDIQPKIGFELASGSYALLGIWHAALAIRRVRFASAVTRHAGTSVR